MPIRAIITVVEIDGTIATIMDVENREPSDNETRVALESPRNGRRRARKCSTSIDQGASVDV